ncbi:MAG TPA: hypothetical protein VNO70_14605 [Blastocatellia bacterium]|nr:hypothetical protein [Blastocatellia bacterium]
MKLYRLKLRPLSAWRTPWQADTIAGLLCWACARTLGGETLREEILGPCLQGEPPFVVSDAFPHDFLPVPEALRLLEWRDHDRKAIKRAQWLKPEVFGKAQGGAEPSSAAFLADRFFRRYGQPHNTLDRLTDTTHATAGSLYALDEVGLNHREINRELYGAQTGRLDDPQYLSVYVRVAGGFEGRVRQLFGALAQTGFGADISAGKGYFEVISDLEDAGWLDNVAAPPNGVILLSTFQPGESDPTEGYWQTFTKFGKVGPDFGLANVFKRPLVMLRPGACFRSTANRPFLGRAIPIEQLLPSANADALRAAGAAVTHLAFGLAVPAALNF